MKLRVGLIGCGGITRVHVDGWKQIPDRAQIVAVADVDRANAEARVAQWGAAADIYADYRELLARSDIDAVDLALPHHLHKEAIVAAADAGKHIMTEKPLCLDLDEAAEIADAVERSGVTFMAGHNQLFFPTIQQAKQMILNGELGRIHMIYSVDAGARRRPLGADKSAWGKPAAKANTWRQDIAKMGGGELIDTGYHPTYRMLFLAGKPPVSVSAVLGTYRMAMDEEDTANVICKFDDGAMGQVYTSWGIRAPGARPILFAVMGDAGQLWAESDKLYYQPVGFQTPAVSEFPGWNQGARTFAAEIEHFVSCIEGGFEPLHSVAEATDTLRIILAGYRSAREGVTVSL